jgi:hypothetical protein
LNCFSSVIIVLHALVSDRKNTQGEQDFSSCGGGGECESLEGKKKRRFSLIFRDQV